MGSKKRKTIPMTVGIFHQLPPAARAMAVLTVASKLAAMDVGMAVGTLLPDSREHQLYVALLAVQAPMHALQREWGASVIEVGKRTDRFIACCRVTIPAVYLDRAVRAVRLTLGRRTPQRSSNADSTRYQKDRYGYSRLFEALKCLFQIMAGRKQS
jgi:hypothetical protein